MENDKTSGGTNSTSEEFDESNPFFDAEEEQTDENNPFKEESENLDQYDKSGKNPFDWYFQFLVHSNYFLSIVFHAFNKPSWLQKRNQSQFSEP